MDQTIPRKIGAYVKRGEFINALKNDLVPQKRKAGYAAANLNPKLKAGKISVREGVKIVEKLQKGGFLKSYVKGVREGKEKTLGTHSVTPKHLLGAMILEEEGAGQKNEAGEITKGSAEARFAAMKNRTGAENFGQTITKHQQEALTEREATKKRNIEVVKAEHIVEAGAEELTTGYSSESKPSQPIHPSFGHAAPETAKPGQPTKSKKTTLGNPSQAIDIFN
jgi:hypothetical protein